MTNDDIKEILWIFYKESQTPISKEIINNIVVIPNYKKFISMGLSIRELNKDFKIRYMKEVIKKTCPKCNTPHVKNGMFCSQKCANSKKWTASDKEKKSIAAKNSLKVMAENKSRTRNIVEANCEICDCIFKTRYGKTKTCSRKCYHLLLSKRNKNKTGGCREGAGYSKSGYYKGIYYGSTYELVWGIYRIDHGLDVKRFSGYIEENGKKYFPDFDVNGEIVEIKGRHTEEVDIKTKMAINAGYNIEVKYKKDLQKEFEWVKENYIYKELYELYDGYKPKYEYICDNCGIKYYTNRKRKTDTGFCCTKCSGSFRAKIKWSSS